MSTGRVVEGGRTKRAAMVGLAALAMGSAACSWTQARPGAEVPEEPAASSPAATAGAPAMPAPPTIATMGADESAPRGMADDLMIQIHEVEGTTAAHAGAMFAPMTEPLEQCSPGQPGTLNVRVVQGDETTTMEVAPGTNVDSDTRRCVLQALAVLDVEEATPAISSPADRPRNFASTLSINWQGF